MLDISKVVHEFVLQPLPRSSQAPRGSEAMACEWVVAFSGGLDSTVLLHLLAQLPLPQSVRAVHINHQLSPNASVWADHCRQFAASLNMPLSVYPVSVNSAGHGLEQAAREARYQILKTHLSPGALLLTAHHLQDQTETLLQRLARGSGWQGLSAMTPLRRLGAGWLGRPLLKFERSELLAYAQHHGLSWVEDESNQSEHFDRNYLRRTVIPMFTQRWPQFDQSVARCAGLLQEADQLLQAYAEEDLAMVDVRAERVGYSCSLEPFSVWSNARRNHVMRTLVLKLGYQTPSQRQLDLLWQVLQAAADRQPRLRWGELEVRRFQQRVYFLPAQFDQVTARGGSNLWDLSNPVTLPDGSCLRATINEQGLRADRAYKVTRRSGAQRSHPHGRQHSQTLKKLLQTHGLEPWLRDRVPLIFDGPHLAAVGDLWVERDYWVQGPQSAVTLNWTYPRSAPQNPSG